VKITLSGYLAQMIAPQLELAWPAPCSVAELRATLAAAYPAAAGALTGGGVRACVDGAMVSEEFLVGDVDQVEFLPPVSGG
jgi:molybdopterin converting factor small subunit